MIKNETIESILNRRSTRMFSDEKVSREEIETVVETGLYAPSSFNKQSWHFTVIENIDVLNELSDVAKDIAKNYPDEMIQKVANNEKYHVFHNAPVAIIVSEDNSAHERTQDCAAASENMLIAAESLGLGSCWLGFIGLVFKGDNERANEYIKKLEIPEGFSPSHAIVIGHKKNKETKAPERRGDKINYIR